jgi:hypothetical protein
VRCIVDLWPSSGRSEHAGTLRRALWARLLFARVQVCMHSCSASHGVAVASTLSLSLHVSLSHT